MPSNPIKDTRIIQVRKAWPLIPAVPFPNFDLISDTAEFCSSSFPAISVGTPRATNQPIKCSAVGSERARLTDDKKKRE